MKLQVPLFSVLLLAVAAADQELVTGPLFVVRWTRSNPVGTLHQQSTNTAVKLDPVNYKIPGQYSRNARGAEDGSFSTERPSHITNKRGRARYMPEWMREIVQRPAVQEVEVSTTTEVPQEIRDYEPVREVKRVTVPRPAVQRVQNPVPTSTEAAQEARDYESVREVKRVIVPRPAVQQVQNPLPTSTEVPQEVREYEPVREVKRRGNRKKGVRKSSRRKTTTTTTTEAPQQPQELGLFVKSGHEEEALKSFLAAYANVNGDLIPGGANPGDKVALSLKFPVDSTENGRFALYHRLSSPTTTTTTTPRPVTNIPPIFFKTSPWQTKSQSTATTPAPVTKPPTVFHYQNQQIGNQVSSNPSTSTAAPVKIPSTDFYYKNQLLDNQVFSSPSTTTAAPVNRPPTAFHYQNQQIDNQVVSGPSTTIVAPEAAPVNRPSSVFYYQNQLLNNQVSSAATPAPVTKSSTTFNYQNRVSSPAPATKPPTVFNELINNHVTVPVTNPPTAFNYQITNQAPSTASPAPVTNPPTGFNYQITNKAPSTAPPAPVTNPPTVFNYQITNQAPSTAPPAPINKPPTAFNIIWHPQHQVIKQAPLQETYAPVKIQTNLPPAIDVRAIEPALTNLNSLSPQIRNPVANLKPSTFQIQKIASRPPVTYTINAQMNANARPIIPFNGSAATRYEFGYRVIDKQVGNDYGHQETRSDDSKSSDRVTSGRYHVLLPDGKIQKVSYYVDNTGYHAMITYEQAKSQQSR